MAMACLGFVTFFPLRPDLSFPFFISRISVSTFSLVDGEYFRVEDFFEAVFPLLAFFPLVDFFGAAVVVAISILQGHQMAAIARSVAWNLIAKRPQTEEFAA